MEHLLLLVRPEKCPGRARRAPATLKL